MISWSIAMSGTNDAGSPAYAMRRTCGGPLRTVAPRVHAAGVAINSNAITPLLMELFGARYVVPNAAADRYSVSGGRGSGGWRLK